MSELSEAEVDALVLERAGGATSATGDWLAADPPTWDWRFDLWSDRPSRDPQTQTPTLFDQFAPVPTIAAAPSWRGLVKA